MWGGYEYVQTFSWWLEIITLNSLQITPVFAALMLEFKCLLKLCQMKRRTWNKTCQWRRRPASAPGGRWVQRGLHQRQQTAPSSWMIPDSPLWHCGRTYRTPPGRKKNNNLLGWERETFCLPAREKYPSLTPRSSPHAVAFTNQKGGVLAAKTSSGFCWQLVAIIQYILENMSVNDSANIFVFVEKCGTQSCRYLQYLKYIKTN